MTVLSTGSRAEIDLTVLATSDVHGAVSKDFVAQNAPQCQGSFARIASYVSTARQATDNLLLLDNGDFLQGTPLCDLMAEGLASQIGAHPVIQAMNHLRYDAAGLGNHEFDYGLPLLKRALSDADFPVVCSNLHCAEQAWQRTFVMERNCVTNDGHTALLKIGLFSVLPCQTLDWIAHDLHRDIEVQTIDSAAKAACEDLKFQGADIIIALAHTGISPFPLSETAENAALAIAQIPEVDALICGHTHKVFPNPAEPGDRDIDPTLGRLCAKPAVMPGFYGSHIGALRLSLRSTNSGWKVQNAEAKAIALQTEPDQVQEDEALRAHLKPALVLAQRQSQAVFGQVHTPIHSFFSRLPGDPCAALTAMATARYARPILKSLGLSDCPLLSVGSAFRSGGRGGPSFFTNVPAGPVTYDDLFSLYPVQNRLCALRATGTVLRNWLELAASNFQQIHSGSTGTLLQDLSFPCYAFDCIFGLSYEFDLSQPARFSPTGAQVSHATRVSDLRYLGRTVLPDDAFILLTNSYRAGGGGNVPGLDRLEKCALPTADMRGLIRAAIADGITLSDLPPTPWRFRPQPKTTAVFRTGPGAQAYLSDQILIPPQRPQTDAQGFHYYQIDLSAQNRAPSLAFSDSSAYIDQ